MRTLLNILWLGLKEIVSLLSDVVMVIFLCYAFTMAIYVQATGISTQVNNASIAFVDEDGQPVIKPLEPVMEVRLPQENIFITRNIVLNLQGLRFDKAGTHEVQISMDDQLLCSVPLRVVIVDPSQAGGPGMA